MPNEEKIAIFDFCETLANFQTADPYVDYVRLHFRSKRMRFLETERSLAIKSKIFAVIGIITRHKYPIYKLSKLYQLRGLSQVELEKYAERYYQDIIKPNLIPSMVEILRQKQQEGYKTFIVSGGYDIYLKFFAAEYNVDQVLSTRIGFRKNIATGIFHGIDCINENKVLLLDQILNRSELYSEAYSDSITDLPLLKWANEGYVISHKNSQKWAKENNFQEIIWE